MRNILLEAHMGVSAECPQNTMPAFTAAVNQGYDMIELDPGVTKDKKIVVLHDTTLNRCARNADGSRLVEEVHISDITYDEALRYDFGIAFSQKFAGTKIPLFADVLKLVKDYNITLKIDNKFERFTDDEKQILFDIVRGSNNIAQMTCSCLESAKLVKEELGNCSIHYDGEITECVLRKLSEMYGREGLTSWVAVKSPGTWWVNRNSSIESQCEIVKKYSRLGMWIVSDDEQFEFAVKMGADIIETTGYIKPQKNIGLKADMHTHSQNSHDSKCSVIDSAEGRIKSGINIMAVTDHIDVEYYKETDIFGLAQNSYKETYEAKEIMKDKINILFGLEMGEAFWEKSVSEKIIALNKCDCVIGSVHAVKYKELTMPYSKIDFSELSDKEINEYLKKYFEDYEYMVRNTNMDIAAHLTCPIRYINGKYNRNISINQFYDEIEVILRFMISKGIALEINTSYVETSGEYLPNINILKLYKSLGGYLITCGSDSHIVKNDKEIFNELYNTLYEIGFKNIYYYKNRIATQCTITEGKI